MNDERPSEDAPPNLRRSRGWALAALLLWLTSMWMDWWQVRFQDVAGNVYDQAVTGPFQPDSLIAHSWGPWSAGVLVAIACLVLFVRIAGRSWLYEPATWTKSLLGASIVVAITALSAFAWPTEDLLWDQFWGTTRFNANGTALVGEVVTRPGLGWWTAWSGVVCGVIGFGVARRPTP